MDKLGHAKEMVKGFLEDPENSVKAAVSRASATFGLAWIDIQRLEEYAEELRPVEKKASVKEEGPRKSILEPGDEVDIYKNYLLKAEPEGKATLISFSRKMGTYLGQTIERWRVVFDNDERGEVVFKNILVGKEEG